MTHRTAPSVGLESLYQIPETSYHPGDFSQVQWRAHLWQSLVHQKNSDSMIMGLTVDYQGAQILRQRLPRGGSDLLYASYGCKRMQAAA